MSTISFALVNSAHGIYSAQVLAETHELFFSTNRIAEESVKIGDEYFTPLKVCLEEGFDGFEEETMETFFNPDNEFFCENVDFIQNGLCVVKVDGVFWKVDSIDGEFHAIHLDAEWCHEKEEYVLA